MTLAGIITRKISQEKTKMENQGDGFNWGMTAKGGWGPPVFSLKG